MANVEILGITEDLSPADNDVIDTQKAAGGAGSSKRVTRANFLADIQAEVDLNTAKVTNATHTGDVTGSGVLTIAVDAVTYEKMQNVVADDVLLGNVAGPNSVVAELDATTVRTLLNVADGANNYTHPNHTGDVTSTGDGVTVIAAGAVDIAMLSATGTADATTFLRGDNTWASVPGGGDALTASPLSQFAATTSAQLAGVISDETGSGSLVFSTSPTLVTPNLGVATATSINGATITSGTLNGTVTGTNTGDQTSIVGITGTVAQFNAAITDGSLGLADVSADTTPQLGGNLDLNNFAITHELTAGEALAADDLCVMNSSGKMVKADADAEATTAGLLAISVDSPALDATGTFLFFGKYTMTGTPFTAGTRQFVSLTAGDFTETKPSTTGQQIRYCGQSLSTSVIFFNPSQSWGEV